MDSRAAVGERLIAPAAELLGRPLGPARAAAPATRATWPPRSMLTVDGLGPRGGHAHHPEEFVSADSVRPRAEIALAVTAAALGTAASSE